MQKVSTMTEAMVVEVRRMVVVVVVVVVLYNQVDLHLHYFVTFVNGCSYCHYCYFGFC